MIAKQWSNAFMIRILFSQNFIFFFSLLFLLIFLINISRFFQLILFFNCKDNIVRNSPNRSKWDNLYVNFISRICYWSIISLFLINSRFMSPRTACVLVESPIILWANFRQSRKICNDDLFSINCAGFINRNYFWC